MADLSITTPEGRLKAFGQEDHVRRYPPDFINQLMQAGFMVHTVPPEVDDAWRGNLMFAEKYSAISTAPLGRWKKSISAYDLAVLQTIARRVMRLMGYDLASVDAAGLTVSQRLMLLREKFTAWVKQP